jgi:hypothetical protein
VADRATAANHVNARSHCTAAPFIGDAGAQCNGVPSPRSLPQDLLNVDVLAACSKPPFVEKVDAPKVDAPDLG